MLSWHLWGLTLDPHCPFASARIKLLFSVMTFTTESTYHCTFLSPPPLLSFFFFSQISGAPVNFPLSLPKQNKTKTKGLGRVVNLIIPWPTVSAQPASHPACRQSRGQPGKGSDTRCLSLTWESLVCKSGHSSLQLSLKYWVIFFKGGRGLPVRWV